MHFQRFYGNALLNTTGNVVKETWSHELHSIFQSDHLDILTVVDTWTEGILVQCSEIKNLCFIGFHLFMSFFQMSHNVSQNYILTFILSIIWKISAIVWIVSFYETKYIFIWVWRQTSSVFFSHVTSLWVVSSNKYILSLKSPLFMNVLIFMWKTTNNTKLG